MLWASSSVWDTGAAASAFAASAFTCAGDTCTTVTGAPLDTTAGAGAFAAGAGAPLATTPAAGTVGCPTSCAGAAGTLPDPCLISDLGIPPDCACPAAAGGTPLTAPAAGADPIPRAGAPPPCAAAPPGLPGTPGMFPITIIKPIPMNSCLSCFVFVMLFSLLIVFYLYMILIKQRLIYIDCKKIKDSYTKSYKV